MTTTIVPQVLSAPECPGCGTLYLTDASGAKHDFATCKAYRDGYAAGSAATIAKVVARLRERAYGLRHQRRPQQKRANWLDHEAAWLERGEWQKAGA